MLASRTTVAHGATDPGLHRDRNEDAFLVDAERGLFAVADGLGGMPHGEVASQLAVARLREASDLDLRDLDELFNQINRTVRREGLKLSGGNGIGTTLTAAIVRDGVATIGHVGDCAAFVVSPGEARQVTHDQTIAEQMRSTGEAPVPEYLNHILTQCLGQSGTVAVEMLTLPFSEGSRLLLCSDGVTKVIEAAEILETMAGAQQPSALVGWLIDTANERGGPDNSTAVALFA